MNNESGGEAIDLGDIFKPDDKDAVSNGGKDGEDKVLDDGADADGPNVHDPQYLEM